MALKTFLAIACIMVSIACCQGQGTCTAAVDSNEDTYLQTNNCAAGFAPRPIKIFQFTAACLCVEDKTYTSGTCSASYHSNVCSHDTNQCKTGFKPSKYEDGGECKCECLEYGTCSSSVHGVECRNDRDNCKRGFSPFSRLSSGFLPECLCDCREDNTGTCAAYYGSDLQCHVRRDNCKRGYKTKDYWSDYVCQCDCVEDLGGCSASYRWSSFQCGVDRHDCKTGSSPHDWYSGGVCKCECRR